MERQADIFDYLAQAKQAEHQTSEVLNVLITLYDGLEKVGKMRHTFKDVQEKQTFLRQYHIHVQKRSKYSDIEFLIVEEKEKAQ